VSLATDLRPERFLMTRAFDVFLLALLLVPAVALILRRWQKARTLASILLLFSLLTGLAVAGITFWSGKEFSADLSQWTPFPFSLTMDRLSAFFVFLICVVAAPVTLFSSSYIERHYAGARRDWLWTLLPLFLISMLLVVTASTGFAFLFGWELMTLFSAALIVVDGDSKERRHNIFIYLLMMHAGAAFVIAAFLLFLPHVHGLGFAQIRTSIALLPQTLRNAIFLLAFVGFGTKAGIVPLHLWLPKAHPIAPTPVSALMSAVMLKTAVYGFVRFAFDFFPGGPAWWGYLVLIAGGFSGLLGVLYANSENSLKRLLAYSSVENIGIIYLALGAALVFVANQSPISATLAIVAGLLHCLNHAIFKGLLFLGAGAVSDSTRTLDLEELGGLLKGMRTTGTVFLVACCSIAGLPLFNGFISEWLLFRSFLAASGLKNLGAAIILPLATGVLALIGGLAAACFAKVFGVAFLGRPRSEQAERASEVSPSMRWSMILLAAACIVIGVMPGLVLRPLSATVQEFLPGAALPEEVASFSALMPWIALSVALLVIAIASLRRVKKTAPTWACGLPGLNPRMQYTSTAFSKPLRKVFSRAYKPDRTIEVLPADQPFFPASISYRSVRTTSFERSLYRPAVDAVVAAAYRLRRLQTGNMQAYLLYIFAALIALLMFMRWS
jgi:hydrogenase-4 component B